MRRWEGEKECRCATDRDEETGVKQEGETRGAGIGGGYERGSRERFKV